MKRIIFLDIDGVLRAPIPRSGNRVKEKNLGHVLAQQYNDEAYVKMNESMLRNVYYEWNGEACYCVRMLCQIPDTKIVLSTSWRDFYRLEIMIKLFDLHKLGTFIVGKTIQKYGNRSLEIKDYLEKNPEVEQYLIIDDMDLRSYFPNHCIMTKDHLFLSEYRRGYDILTGKKVKDELF